MVRLLFAKGQLEVAVGKVNRAINTLVQTSERDLAVVDFLEDVLLKVEEANLAVDNIACKTQGMQTI